MSVAEIIDRISKDLAIPASEVTASIRMAAHRCRIVKIPKRNGGYRLAVQPPASVKPFLSWIRHEVLDKLPVSPVASAFRSGASTLSNACIHRHSRYSVRIDVANFFPSIQGADLRQTIVQNASRVPDWSLKPENIDIIIQACFDSRGVLPIGYSTSPIIANSVMYELDSRLIALISDSEIYGVAKISRYADDFVFSTDKRGACAVFSEALGKELSKSENPKLKINASKTRFMSRDGGSTLITGLRVTSEGSIKVHADYKDHVRLLLRLYKQKRLNPEEIPALVGHLSYIQHVDAKLFTKLSFKYDLEISQLRQSDGSPDS